MKVLPSRRIGRVIVTYLGYSGKDFCGIGFGPKLVEAYPYHLANGNFAAVNVSKGDASSIFTKERSARDKSGCDHEIVFFGMCDPNRRCFYRKGKCT